MTWQNATAHSGGLSPSHAWGQSISVGTLGRSRNYIADAYVDRFAHIGELSRLRDRLHRRSAKTVPITLSIGLLNMAGYQGPIFDTGDTLSVVNEASADVSDHRDFTVDVPSAGPVTFHTVVVLPNGKIQTSSEEWPVGGSPCPPASFRSS